jgi:hypothetical protein
VRTVACSIAAILMSSGFGANGQVGDPRNSLQQRLTRQFSLTQVAGDRVRIVSAGTSLILQRDNLLMYSTICPSSPVSTYKNGKLSQSFGHNFARDLGGSLRMPGTATTASCPQQRFVTGTKLWVTRINVQKDAVVFQLYCTPDNSIPYYGDLKFPFEKGSSTPDQTLAIIAEVLTVERAQVTEQPPPPAPAPVPTPTAVPPLKLPSTYVNARAQADQLQLSGDHTFSLREAGQTYRGTFTVNGNALDLTISDTNTTTAATIQGNTLTDGSGQTWVLQDQAGATPTSGNTLQNEDIIRMAKAGFEDGTIIAKIGSSKCQFDTSTDALIWLKQSGVSPAVIRAVVSGK